MIIMLQALRFCIVAALLTRVAAAQPARLVADLAPASKRGEISLFLPVIPIGRYFYMTGIDSTSLGQVWRTDGAPGGLERVTSVDGGFVDSLTALGDDLFFVAFESSGPALWKIPAASGNAERVATVTGIASLARAGNALVFSAKDDAHGAELWASDGTSSGTRILRDIIPGTASSGPFDFTEAGPITFFFTTTPAGHAELWRTDGTSSGTTLVKDFGLPPAEGNHFFPLGVVAGNLVFTAYVGNGRFRLWRSDATPGGTLPIAEFGSDILTGIPIPFPYAGPESNGTVSAGFLYFAANDGVHGRELWKTDGSAARTSLVADIQPGQEGSGPFGFTALGASVLFEADDGTHGSEPWISDGTLAGTRLLEDVHPGPDGSYPFGFLGTGAVAFFGADDGASGTELWRTDGTVNGTFRVADVAPGEPGSRPSPLFFGNGGVYFEADSGAGTQLWKSDGSEAGTMVVEDLARPESSFPAFLTDVSGRLFFSTVTVENGDAAYRSLWVTRGSAESTTLVRDFKTLIDPAFEPATLFPIGGRMFFRADDGEHGIEPWVSDGTPNGTHLIKDLVSPAPGWAVGDSTPFAFTLFQGSVVFATNGSPVNTAKLWKTNGTEEGTEPLVDLGPHLFYYGTPLFHFGSRLYFALTDSSGSGVALWRSDGTSHGTALVEPIGPFGIDRMLAVGDAFYFPSGNALWRSDGTEAGTRTVFDGTEFINPFVIEEAAGLVYFLVGNSQALWRTDGTPAGTVLLAPSAQEIASAGSLLFFTRDDGIHGVELWRTDGSPAGTSIVRDVFPGHAGSQAGNLRAIGDLVYFSANDGVHGVEPWVSDGTEKGTRLIQDINPGPDSSRPTGFTLSGGLVYFAADDGAHGVELWAVPDPGAGRRVIAPASPAPPPVTLRR
jgi:ELWxxDGT repeat protein